MRERIERFLASPAAHNVDEYTATLELTPPCPLYLGSHMYEEPNSCRGAGACGRNQYMIELKATYEHFGFDLAITELPDFLPVMIDFLAVSSAHPERDGIGLRRRFVDQYLQPGIPAMRKALQKYESVYDLLMEALEFVAEEDMERLADDPVWLAPEVKATIPVRMGTPASNLSSSPDMSMTGWERQ
jgi:nitrate reductase molybdenum cofactor assembly chaperone NarJ/NarW